MQTIASCYPTVTDSRDFGALMAYRSVPTADLPCAGGGDCGESRRNLMARHRRAAPAVTHASKVNRAGSCWIEEITVKLWRILIHRERSTEQDHAWLRASVEHVVLCASSASFLLWLGEGCVWLRVAQREMEGRDE